MKKFWRYWLLETLGEELELKLTRLFLTKISFEESDITAQHLSQILHEVNIKNFGIRLDESQLHLIPLPAIVQIKLGSTTEFQILKNVSKDGVECLSYSTGLIHRSLIDFNSVWTGFALLLETNSKSGEPNYAFNHRLEIIGQIRKGAIYSFTALGLLALCIAWPAFIFPFLFIAFGLGLSAALLLQTLGQETILGQAVCKSGSATDCNKVVNSKFAKVYGDISLAEIALLFFAILLGVQIVSLATGQGYNFLLGWLSFAAVPVTLFSIYYQWRVLKTWCLLCLGVVACLWGLAGFYGYHIQHWSYGWPAIQAFGIGIAVPLLFWFLVRTSVMQAARVPGLEKGLSKFRRSLSVFEALAAQIPEVQPEVYPEDVVLGNKEAGNNITIVTNPTCGPCVRAHQFVESWLEEHGTNLKVIVRFAVNPADTGTSGTIAKHLISLGLHGDERLQTAMHAWYVSEKPVLQVWLNRFGQAMHPVAQERLAQHSRWCRANQINATPTILFNGRQIPDEFSLSDFEYFLRLKMAEVEMEMAAV